MLHGTGVTSCAAGLVVALAAVAPAQAGPPSYVPKRAPMLHTTVAGIDELLSTWPKLRIYPLLEEYGLVERVRGLSKASSGSKRAALLRKEAMRCGLQLDAYQLSSLLTSIGGGIFQSFDGEDYRQVEMLLLQWQEDGEQRFANVSVSCCSPRALGRWASHFEDEVRWWRDCGWFDVRDDLKIDGLPATAFVLPEAERAKIEVGGGHQARWFLQLPGTFVDASGSLDLLEDFGRIEMAPPKLPPGIRYDAYVGAIAAVDDSMSEISRALLAGFERLRFAAHIEGELVREEIEVLLGEPGDDARLADVLFGGAGPLVPQALPKGGLAQLRCRLATGPLFELLDAIGLLQQTPPDLRQNGQKAFDGALALGLCAPAPGGVIPRVYLTLGLADADAFAAVVAAWRQTNPALKEVTYGKVPCTILELPGVPQGIQPTFCVIEDRLHVAESPLSMKAFLRAQEGGVEAMAVEGAKEPANVPGERLASLELRIDPAAAYRSFYDNWLTLLQMGLGGGESKLSRDDLPDPDDFDDYAIPVQARFFRDGRRVGMHSVGTLGGLAGSIYAVMIPVMADRITASYQPLAGPLASFKLERISEAIGSFERREGRLPKDLAELVVAEKLSAAALTMPGDELAEQVRLADGATVTSSFRYFAEPVAVEVFGNTYTARVIQIEPGHNRCLLDVDGAVREIWGDAGDASIDSFATKAAGDGK